MPKTPLLITALVLQVAAQALGGIWGAAIGGVLIGLALRQKGAFRIGFLAAVMAAGLLLVVGALRGASVTDWANTIGTNFNLPGWGLLVLTLLLPGLQSGGLAGGIARIGARRDR